MQVQLDYNDIESYRRFVAIKSLPQYRFRGRIAEFPDEYAAEIGLSGKRKRKTRHTPRPFLFDYQRDISLLAIRKRKFALFMDCGAGKTLIFLEFARAAMAALPTHRHVLIVSPLMVVPQTIAECRRFYGDSLPIEQVSTADLQDWLGNDSHDAIGITNYEALRPDLRQGRLGALILDESSMLKSHYGKWGTKCLELGRGLEWKLACTGTPAPNDRIEYANHAVFLDHFPTVNAFLATFFVNRGQTDNRWELKPHALRPFYRSLSHWCIFLANPGIYGWQDNAEPLPPIHVHVEHVGLTAEQERLAYKTTGTMFAAKVGGITNRAALSGIAKGWHKGADVATNKPQAIRSLVSQWENEESTIIWCWYNREQELIAEQFPGAANISGATPHDERLRLIDDFKAKRRRVLISKPKILGFGLNLEVATRQVFSGLVDSYEAFYQAVKRSNRYGSTQPLNVHIPVTDIERPMIDTVLRKAKQVQSDTEEQESLFKEIYSRHQR